MTTVPVTTPLPISESTSEDNQTNSDTDLSVINTEDEMNTDISSWTDAERKKLQYMMSFIKNISECLVNMLLCMLSLKRELLI